MINEIELKKYKFGLMHMLSDEMSEAACSVKYEPMYRSMVTEIRIAVWGNQIGDEIKVPVNLWNSFKHILPKFIKQYIRIKYRVISFHALYPDFKPSPGLGKYVVKMYDDIKDWKVT